MKESKYIKEAILFINRDFDLRLSVEDTSDILDDVRMQLSKSIRYLMLNNFEKLMQILHRVDVNEMHVKSAFKKEFDETADELVDLVIDRQLQKVKSRQQNRESDDYNSMKWD